jgi:hypothetical protein
VQQTKENFDANLLPTTKCHIKKMGKKKLFIFTFELLSSGRVGAV